MKNKKVIKTLVNTNDPTYQLVKACKELSELNTAVLQYVTKKGRKTTKQEIIDEIGDVKIRIKILEKVFGEKEVKKRVDFKLKKFGGYIKEGKYEGGI